MFFLDTGHISVREVQTEGNAVAWEYHWGDKLVIAGSSNSSVAGINVECFVWHYAYSGNQSFIPQKKIAREVTGSQITIGVKEIHHDQHLFHRRPHRVEIQLVPRMHLFWV
jgi:hypothetical protein